MLIRLAHLFLTLTCVVLLLIGCTYKNPNNNEIELPTIKLANSSYEAITVPDFSQYTNIKNKKSDFFTFIRDYVITENDRIAHLRSTVMALKKKPTDSLTSKEIEWLDTLKETYNIDQTITGEALFTLIDRRLRPVPESLALAQAALESGWGTSRFALEGYNYFGQWCFDKGCGIVPTARASGLKHEIAVFKSPQHAVAAYIRNINSHKAFKKVRDIRYQLAQHQKPVTGTALAEGLIKYSEEGEHYINKIKKMIKINQLENKALSSIRSNETTHTSTSSHHNAAK
ncbi:glucosaminidase domain-containing protein [Marinagarivorans algicola]|uniref:glucosaminidase domain-containing protein n=1 Tax=Marinagarivorans algicola TaxID=1513270 RepID=UPI0006B96225|nr:glucosaminidase domain-containing protein [Marinagarivorans algicola]